MNVFAAKNMAVLYMVQYDLIEQGWSFRLDTAKRRFGCCMRRQKVISLSAPLTRLNSVEDVKDVILHEIAHALAGPNVHHGPEWKAICIRIGAKPERCYNEELVITPPSKYHATCECGKVYKRHQRPQKGRLYFCKCQDSKKIKAYLQYKRV